MLHFFKNFADVETNNAKAEHQHAADKQQKDYDRCKTRCGSIDKIGIQCFYSLDNCNNEEDNSAKGNKLQRFA